MDNRNPILPPKSQLPSAASLEGIVLTVVDFFILEVTHFHIVHARDEYNEVWTSANLPAEGKYNVTEFQSIHVEVILKTGGSIDN